MNNISITEVEKVFVKFYEFKNIEFENLNTLVNDIFAVTTPKGKFALKLYHTPYRTFEEVQWETDLLLHLINHNVPVSKLVVGKSGYINIFQINGQNRVGVLFEWAHGKKPKPSLSTYTILGKTAAQIHQAADTFTSEIKREQYNAHVLIDEQLLRMKEQLIEADQLERFSQLADRLKKYLNHQVLDKGICHMDLTLDNIHRKDDDMTVFDFDSAGECWRAIEPYGVLLTSREYFNAWLDGYRSIRNFNKDNENAVAAFVIIGEIRNVVWKLGLANSSRGKPLMTSNDLPKVVDEWLSWEEKNIVYA
jgi:Ser/Thr protein kinase RdoA (MazF antagonist)